MTDYRLAYFISDCEINRELGTEQPDQRCYEHAIAEFIDWFCSEPRLGFNKVVVTRYRMHLSSETPLWCSMSGRRRGLDDAESELGGIALEVLD
jgi:hypothetical protein